MIGFRTIYPLRTGNKLVYSSFPAFEEPKKVTASLSIKYSHHGTEQYEVRGKGYDVKTGEFLFIPPNDPFYTLIDSDTEVIGLCIDIEQGILKEAAAALLCKEEDLLANPGITQPFALLPDFCYKTSGGQLGAYLQQLGAWAENDELCLGSTEFFYTLAQTVLRQHLPFIQQAGRIKTVRPATQKELLRRLLLAKELMEEEFAKDLDIRACAKVACLSPFHFIRSFKQVFGVTPHQYILQKRLVFAKQQLLYSPYSVNDIALFCGFANAPQFIALFKKREGITPALYRLGKN